MAGEWTPISLGAACTKIGSGATPRGGSDVYLASGPYSLIRSQNVCNDGFHHDGLAFIGEQHAAELANVEVFEGDVLLNITGDSVARACQVDPGVLPARVNQHVAIIRPDPEQLDPRFLRYFLVSPEMQAKLLSWAGSGGTRNALTKGMIESFDVFAPEDIEEQRVIAHILGALDDKIELNRRMNETLEAMARALFKSWFVDFDPVRAKANLPSPAGRGTGGEGPHCSSHAYPPTELRDFARALRNNQTDAEHLMWRMLRDRRIAGAKFRRQHPVPPYVLDFYCHELKLAIELDGGQHGEPTGRERDRQRDAALSERGITVLRFWNHEVLNETEAVLEQAYRTVMERASPSPQTPLPEGEGFCGLPKPIADLFPDSFEHSELGEIPEGWEVKTLGELLELAYGKALKADKRQHGTVPVYGSNGQVGLHHEKLVTGPGIIVGRKGNPGIVKWVSTDFFPIDTTFYVVPTDRCRSLHFLFYALKLQDLASLGADSAVPGLNRNLAYMSKQIIPSGPDSVFDAFDSFVQPLFERIYEAENESRILASLRDALLSKLISGELRVRSGLRAERGTPVRHRAASVDHGEDHR